MADTTIDGTVVSSWDEMAASMASAWGSDYAQPRTADTVAVNWGQALEPVGEGSGDGGSGWSGFWGALGGTVRDAAKSYVSARAAADAQQQQAKTQAAQAQQAFRIQAAQSSMSMRNAMIIGGFAVVALLLLRR